MYWRKAIMKISLRKFTREDIPQYYMWRNDLEVARFDQPGFLRPMGYEEVEAWSERMVTGLTFIICVDDKPVGTCAFMNLDERNRNAEIALVIGDKNYWSQGVGTQALKSLLEMGFNGLNLHKLYLHVFEFNKRAIGLYEKLGFKLEGTLRDMHFHEGKYEAVYHYGILRSDWIATQK